jgi:hypothetical protein
MTVDEYVTALLEQAPPVSDDLVSDVAGVFRDAEEAHVEEAS